MAEPAKKETEEVEGTDGSQEPKKKSKLLSILLIAVFVLALSGGGYLAYTMYIGPKFFQKNDQSNKGQKASKAEVSDKMGAVISLKPFIVNLVDEKGLRYLKVTIDLEVDSAEESVKAEIEKHVPQLRDMIIMLLTSKKYDEVMSLEGKIKMRDDIISRSNQFLKKNKVKTIYFNEFVVQ